jgi:hypothetical protein
MGEVALLVIGTLLLLAGVVVGGRRARATGLSGVGAAPLAVAGVGAMCLVAGVILLGNEPPAKGAVTATITSSLDSRMVSDDMTVFIDGRRIGVLKLTVRSPEARLKVTVSKAGRHSYKIESLRHVKGHRPNRLTQTSDKLRITGRQPLLVYYGSDDKMEPFLTPPL